MLLSLYLNTFSFMGITLENLKMFDFLYLVPGRYPYNNNSESSIFPACHIQR